ncbi:MAG: MFS transporter [Sphingomonadales bacterium]
MAQSRGTGRQLRHTFYASGNMGKSSLWSFVELFALFYLTDILGIPASVAGTIILLSLIWDGLTDPLMGMIADRLRTRSPTVRLYFLTGAPVAAIAFIALFQAASVNPDYRIVYIFVVLIVLRTAYTIVDVPHNSMLSFLSSDSRDRTNIASMRIFFSAVGRFGVTVLSMAMFKDQTTIPLVDRFSVASIWLAGIYLLVLAVCLAAIWNIRVHHARTPNLPFAPLALVRDMASNSQLMIVFALTAMTSLTTPIIGTAMIYFGKYGLGSESYGATALAIMAAAQAVSLLFWSKLSNRMIYKRHAAQMANLLLAAGMAASILLLVSPFALYTVAGVAGFAMGGIYMLNWSMLPDALDYGEIGRNGRPDMAVFGLFTLTNKAFIGLSQAIAGWTLALYGYEADSEATIASIGPIITTLMTFPLVGALFCTMILRWHVQPQAPRAQRV